MQFKKLFYSNFGAIIISGLVGIFMAFMDWSMGVGSTATREPIFFSTAIMWFYS